MGGVSMLVFWLTCRSVALGLPDTDPDHPFPLPSPLKSSTHTHTPRQQRRKRRPTGSRTRVGTPPRSSGSTSTTSPTPPSSCRAQPPRSTSLVRSYVRARVYERVCVCRGLQVFMELRVGRLKIDDPPCQQNRGLSQPNPPLSHSLTTLQGRTPTAPTGTRPTWPSATTARAWSSPSTRSRSSSRKNRSRVGSERDINIYYRYIYM